MSQLSVDKHCKSFLLLRGWNVCCSRLCSHRTIEIHRYILIWENIKTKFTEKFCDKQTFSRYPFYFFPSRRGEKNPQNIWFLRRIKYIAKLFKSLNVPFHLLEFLSLKYSALRTSKKTSTKNYFHEKLPAENYIIPLFTKFFNAS